MMMLQVRATAGAAQGAKSISARAAVPGVARIQAEVSEPLSITVCSRMAAMILSFPLPCVGQP